MITILYTKYLISLSETSTNLNVYVLLTLFIFVCQTNDLNEGVFFLYILVTNHTPTYILNSFACQKNVNKASHL